MAGDAFGAEAVAAIGGSGDDDCTAGISPCAPTAGPPADRLERMFSAQRRVTAMTGSDPPGYPRDVDGRVSALCTAIIQEAVELQNTTGWKWWKQRTSPLDMAHAREELVDVLHFAVQAAIVLGMSPDDLVAEYERKAAINVRRQEAGY